MSLVVLLLVLFFFLPICILQVSLGIRTLLALDFLFVLFCMRQYQIISDYGEDRLGTGSFSVALVLTSIVVGTVIKLFFLYKKYGRGIFAHPTRIDKVILASLFLALSIGWLWNKSGVCYKNLEKMSDLQLIKNYVRDDESFPEYYRISKAKNSIFGSYRRTASLYYRAADSSGEYKEENFLLNACGQKVSEIWSMGYKKEEIEKNRAYLEIYSDKQ